jgi:hypothetical protein
MFTKKTMLACLIAATLLGATSLQSLTSTWAAGTEAADAQTTAIVNAADAFLATLSDAQKKAALFDFADAAQRKNWSNFPLGGPGADRKGVKWGDMNEAQRKALIGLLGTVLSPKGAAMVQEQVAADNIVAADDASWFHSLMAMFGPSVSFGSNYYFVSFVGAPSATVPWMLQFGGHHLAINATVVGPHVTLSPSLTGGQPQKFTSDGKPVYIVEEEANRAAALLGSLTDVQRSKAVISAERIDLVSGPGKDGMTMKPEGLPAADMTDAQKAQFLALIEARLGMLNADDFAAEMVDVKKNLDQTSFGWWGPSTPLGAAYFRVTGPTVLIEFSPESNDGDPTDHIHSMYRDPTNEYGAAWTSLK